jgi:hypothetical protein
MWTGSTLETNTVGKNPKASKFGNAKPAHAGTKMGASAPKVPKFTSAAQHLPGTKMGASAPKVPKFESATNDKARGAEPNVGHLPVEHTSKHH